MTPQQKIQSIAVKNAMNNGALPNSRINDDTIDDLFASLEEADLASEYLSDVRTSGIETGLKCEWSRNYDSEAVAGQAADGTWVGWTHWYGGGKHGEPEAIDWIGEAYDLACKEEQKMVTVREFTKVAA